MYQSPRGQPGCKVHPPPATPAPSVARAENTMCLFPSVVCSWLLRGFACRLCRFGCWQCGFGLRTVWCGLQAAVWLWLLCTCFLKSNIYVVGSKGEAKF